jgi:hypothetical protein
MDLNESPEIRWFEKYSGCRMCRKPSAGILRGTQNQSFGDHCVKCADKRIRDSKKAREQIARAEARALGKEG